MIILSIDSGVERTGWAVFEKDKKHKDGFVYITSGLITTTQSRTASERLFDIYTQLQHLIKAHNPHILVIEQLLFFKNKKTAIAVAQAQGAIMSLASQNVLAVQFIAPLQIKQAVTGYGQADKKSVQKMIKIQLGLTSEITQDDQADAVACGLAYCLTNENLT